MGCIYSFRPRGGPMRHLIRALTCSFAMLPCCLLVTGCGGTGDESSDEEVAPPESQGVTGAVVLYVAKGGSSTSSCTSTAPCTLARAESLADAGDTIRFKAGTYAPFTVGKSGVSGARLVYDGSNRAAVIDGTGVGSDCIMSK